MCITISAQATFTEAVWYFKDLDIVHEEPGSSDDEHDPDSTVHIRVLTDVEVELPTDSLEHVKYVI